MSIRDEEALEYHASGRPGKLEITPTKPFTTARDLSLAYTPGVSVPVRRIADDPDASYDYTSRGNLVAVVSNGTAVLGLGNVGAAAAKPVMEGKAVLFKKFADIDAFDIEVDAAEVDRFCEAVRPLEATFGGINLEDIHAPDCFEIEQRLGASMNIPVFHDDQHGTAIISGAAFLNALELAGKRIEDVRVVFSGAGSAAIACARLYISLGVREENILMTDSRGVLHTGRTDGMNPHKAAFARETSARSLADAVRGADVFVGVSVGGVLTPEMLQTMNESPIVFAMANPDPEIDYDLATRTRPDAIVATGRSDYPNQVNNVLGFPYVFRGALDVRASAVNEPMKRAAVQALADLAKEEVPESVSAAYGDERFHFGRDYIIPKPFDARVLLRVAPAVARAAMETGVARRPIEDFRAYEAQLASLFHPSTGIVRRLMERARRAPKRVVLPEGEQPKILKACEILRGERVAEPVLLGRPDRIRAELHRHGIHLDDVEIVHPEADERFERYAQTFWRLRQRRGVTETVARQAMRSPNTFGLMMVREGDADGLVSGLTTNYPDAVRPAMQIIGRSPETTTVCGMYIVMQRNRVRLFADATMNIEPDAAGLADIAVSVAEEAKRLDIEPRVAMLSFSNFGSAPSPTSEKVADATERVKRARPDLTVDGEMQVDTAVSGWLRRYTFPFCELDADANVFVFPDLNSGNIGYKLVHRLGGAEVIGPLLIGMDKPVHVLQRDTDINSIVNLAAATVVDAQAAERDGGARGRP